MFLLLSHLVVNGNAVLEPGDLRRRPAAGRALKDELAAAPRLHQLGRRRRQLHELLQAEEEEERVKRWKVLDSKVLYYIQGGYIRFHTGNGEKLSHSHAIGLVWLCLAVA